MKNENNESFNFGVKDGVRGFYTNPSRADDSFIPFSSGLNAIITVRSASSVYSSAGNKHGDTLLDTQFTMKNGKVEFTKVITNAGTVLEAGLSNRNIHLS